MGGVRSEGPPNQHLCGVWRRCGTRTPKQGDARTARRDRRHRRHHRQGNARHVPRVARGGAQGLMASDGLTLDTGALIALERGDKRMRMALHGADEQGVLITVPAVVLIEWWRGAPRQL